jgi:hypothetical protein
MKPKPLSIRRRAIVPLNIAYPSDVELPGSARDAERLDGRR